MRISESIVISNLKSKQSYSASANVLKVLKSVQRVIWVKCDHSSVVFTSDVTVGIRACVRVCLCLAVRLPMLKSGLLPGF